MCVEELGACLQRDLESHPPVVDVRRYPRPSGLAVIPTHLALCFGFPHSPWCLILLIFPLPRPSIARNTTCGHACIYQREQHRRIRGPARLPRSTPWPGLRMHEDLP